MRLTLLLVLSSLLITGCAPLSPQEFAETKPGVDPQAHFAGRVHSWGVFENRAGEPVERFTTASVGRWAGKVLILHQEFTYEDGQRQKRHWRIHRVDAHWFEATANDVVGIATGEA